MRKLTWRTIAICSLLLPAALHAQTVTEEPPAFQAPPAVTMPAPPPPTSDAPLLSNDSLPPAPPLPVTGSLPPVSTLPGIAATVSAPVAAPPSPTSFQPPVTAVMPPPPASPIEAQPAPAVLPPPVPSLPTSPLPVLPEGLSLPAAPAAGSQENQAITLTPEQAAVIRKLSQSLVALRHLADDPRSNEALGKVLNTGKSCAAILGLGAFPVMPRFTARSDETVVRDRSYDSWEYRKYGAFQTRLDGRIRPVAGHLHVDLTFRARGRSGVVIRGSITLAGMLDGSLAVEGYDAWGRPWKMALRLDSLLLRDDGLPSGGMLALSGSDPSGASRAGHLKFPIADPTPQSAQKERRRPEHRGRRY